MVGIDDSPPPPMELGEPGTPEFRGYEVDILETVAARLGLSLKFRRAVWSQILDELERRRGRASSRSSNASRR
jgi:ABC-type amino acid transport substrate-binding protein